MNIMFNNQFKLYRYQIPAMYDGTIPGTLRNDERYVMMSFITREKGFFEIRYQS